MNTQPLVLSAHLHLRMEPTLLAALETAAAADQRKPSDLARLFIAEGLLNRPPSKQQKRRSPRPPSA